MKVYTKTGDNGTTGLFGGKRVKKSDPIIEALGSIDELSCALGLITPRTAKIRKIQKELYEIGAIISGAKRKAVSEKWLEDEIDRMQKKIPQIHEFVLPVGPVHFARAVCRRAERRIIDSGFRQNDVLKYLNRLSSYLFVLALCP